ncbi:hypothetical protein [Holophaga foetida]|uniref:hypothetical protein n=1 Tax=Holophaga foetida TaxID=35839 RepID=UPI0002473373|nr:hypothetical protein [Holophaga foetida]
MASHNRYREEEGTVLIELRLRNSRQLFDARDPAPFRERDLDDDAVDYLVSAVEEFPLGKPLKLLLFFEDEPLPHHLRPEELVAAIRAHFEYEIELTTRKLKRLLAQGQIAALVAAILLGTCLTLNSTVIARMRPTPWREILKEGLLILGWVSWWRPLEAFLYDWWPYLRRIRLQRKIVGMEIVVEYE